jgi:hypothetical protein
VLNSSNTYEKVNQEISEEETSSESSEEISLLEMAG